MFLKFLLFLLSTSLLLGFNLNLTQKPDINNSTTKNLSTKEYAFINIKSNIFNPKIFINNKLIGEAPIYNYPVKFDKKISLKAIGPKKYSPNILEKIILVKQFDTNTYKFNFKEGLSKLVFIGEDGYLFINDKFKRTLNSSNRVVIVKANENVKIEIKDSRDNLIMSEFKNLKANKLYNIKYPIVSNIPKFETYKEPESESVPPEPIQRIATTVTVGNLLWENNLNNKTMLYRYNEAESYCNLLTLEHRKWRVPTLEELSILSEHMNVLQETTGKAYYWSRDDEIGRYPYWKYKKTYNFFSNNMKLNISTFYEGNIRCVSELTKDEIDKLNDTNEEDDYSDYEND